MGLFLGYRGEKPALSVRLDKNGLAGRRAYGQTARNNPTTTTTTTYSMHVRRTIRVLTAQQSLATERRGNTPSLFVFFLPQTLTFRHLSVAFLHFPSHFHQFVSKIGKILVFVFLMSFRRGYRVLLLCCACAGSSNVKTMMEKGRMILLLRISLLVMLCSRLEW